MEKVFHFSSPREAYRCDAAVIWCFDHRFHLAFAKFLKRIGITATDIIKVAGGAKALASPSTPFERDFVIDQVRLSMRLHATQRAVLMLHSDCGGYGGLEAFGNDPDAEARRQEEELRRAEACLKEAIPELEIDCYFVDFEGVWKVDTASRTLTFGAGGLPAA